MGVHIAPNPAILQEEAAAAVVAALQEAGREGPRISLALSGGSTPRGLYRILSMPPYREAIPWSQLEIFWGDERTVPPDHPDSNYRMAREALLAGAPLAPGQIHRLQGEKEPQAEAQRYGEEIRSVLGSDPPRFDLLFLGMGAEGHTASLFPGSPALTSSRLVESVYVEALHTTRLTVTPRLINASKRIFFLVAGREKAGALQQVLECPRDPALFPAQAVSPLAGTVNWFLDQEAAAFLSTRSTAAGKGSGSGESSSA